MKHFAASLIAAIAIWTASTTGEYHRVKITLEPNPTNRYVCFYVQQVQGGAQEKTSCWSVQAEKEARTTWREVKDLSSGRWVLRAAVLRNNDQAVLSNEIEIHVLGPNYSPPGE
jgi:hypothetical protein